MQLIMRCTAVMRTGLQGMAGKDGASRPRRLRSLASLVRHGLAVAGAFTVISASAQVPAVHIVWMGGSDCPPCEAWRRDELPKLQSSPEFKPVAFSYVNKVIRSSIPSAIFLPSEVKPYKEKLDHASAMRAGSPQVAILVNGEVFDYFHGTRSADEIVQMLTAIRTNTAYPFARCVRVSKTWRQCDVRG